MSRILFYDENNKQSNSIVEYLTDFCKHEVDVANTIEQTGDKLKGAKYDVLVVGLLNNGLPPTDHRDIIYQIRNKVYGDENSLVPVVIITICVHPPILSMALKNARARKCTESTLLQYPVRLADIQSAIEGMNTRDTINSHSQSAQLPIHLITA